MTVSPCLDLATLSIGADLWFGPPQSKKACVQLSPRLIKAADHIHVGVRTCTVYTGESTEEVRHEL